MLAQRLIQRISSNVLRGCTRVRCNQTGTSSYEGDGKTSVSILNKETENGLMINAFSQMGFRLNNGMMVVGPMAIFPRSVMSWNIRSFNDINEETLSLFCVLEPKIDVLVIGTGDEPITAEFSKKIMYFMKKYEINVEVLPTEQACTTFNFLNGERRMVGGALLPPMFLTVSENDFMHDKISSRKLRELKD